MFAAVSGATRQQQVDRDVVGTHFKQVAEECLGGTPIGREIKAPRGTPQCIRSANTGLLTEKIKVLADEFVLAEGAGCDEKGKGAGNGFCVESQAEAAGDVGFEIMAGGEGGKRLFLIEDDGLFSRVGESGLL